MTTAPKGFLKLAWATYPSLRGLWRPSLVHLETTERNGALCGARPGKRSILAAVDVEFESHERDAGLCSRCWGKAELKPAKTTRDIDVLASKFAAFSKRDMQTIRAGIEEVEGMDGARELREAVQRAQAARERALKDRGNAA